MKKKISALLSLCFALSSLPALTSCGESETVLRIASWEEYIDEGGDDSYIEGCDSMIEDFEKWYEEKYDEKIKVVYVPLSDNEQMYAKIDKFNRHYDLLCPSEYMFIKLANENRLEQYPDEFFDTENPDNYYAKNVTPFIKNTFENNEIKGVKWSKYAAGYMWGTTGFIYNTEKVNADDVKSWNVYFNPKYSISAKNNVRDSYFAGLGMYYENELLQMRSSVTEETLPAYQTALSSMMNDTSVQAMNKVESLLKKMKSTSNFWGFETDNAKSYLISGDIDISYQWSGDAVYIMDEAESEDLSHPIRFDYCVPEASSNLWFDGWVMMKNANVKAAIAFVNFVSMPENVIRNMYYIGYTSCVGGEEVFDYVSETYSAEDDDEDVIEYDLSEYFGEGYFITASTEQLTRQLYAQYPDKETLNRCCVMQYFEADVNKRANKLWKNVSGA
ncbi:MAG: ABC transporter substrate-binding protein [Clostridia bacterium]|nr:ABC transporter substrate-binding protein [Clostridia bacterium]